MHTTTREQRRQLERDNAKWPLALQEVPRDQWPTHLQEPGRLRVWRLRHWLVQEFSAPAPAIVRLSINRTSMQAAGRWEEGVSWEALQDIKAQVGYAQHDAVEVYPAARDVVNVANMRHLWVMAEPLAFAWRAR